MFPFSFSGTGWRGGGKWASGARHQRLSMGGPQAWTRPLGQPLAVCGLDSERCARVRFAGACPSNTLVGAYKHWPALGRTTIPRIHQLTNFFFWQFLRTMLCPSHAASFPIFLSLHPGPLPEPPSLSSRPSHCPPSPSSSVLDHSAATVLAFHSLPGPSAATSGLDPSGLHVV